VIVFPVRLAFRNLGRHRKRTLVVGLGVTLGVAAVTIQSGLVAGVQHQMIDSLVVAQFGHLAIVPNAGAGPDSGSDEAPSLIRTTADVNEVVRELVPEARVVPGLSTLGMAFGEISGTGRVVLWGVTDRDPMLDDRRTGLQGPATVEEGAVYIGAALAEQLEAQEGDLITLSVLSPDGDLDAMDFEIAEVLVPGAPWQDYFVYVRLDQLQFLMGIDRAVASLRLYLDAGIRGADRAAARLNRGFIESAVTVRAVTYEKTGRLYLGIIRASRVQAMVVEIILLVAVALGVASAQILSIHERRREIGTMTALGTSPGSIRLIFLTEGMVLSVIAGLAGAAIGAAITGALGIHGIETGIEAFRWMIGGASLTPRVDASAIGWTMLELIVVVTLSGLYPAWRAAQLKPAIALQGATG